MARGHRNAGIAKNGEARDSKSLIHGFDSRSPHRMDKDTRDFLDEILNVDERFVDNYIQSDLSWGYCNTCEKAYLKCVKCGNNSCNGCYGELEDGTQCDLCQAVYAIQSYLWKIAKLPKKEEFIRNYKHSDTRV